MIHHRLTLLVCTVIAVCRAGLAVEADAAVRAMTPRDLARVQEMTDAVVSPDGSLIAAVRSVPRILFEEPDGPAWTELYVIDRQGGRARPFVTGGVRVSDVEWRPDGSAISFLSQRGDDDSTSLYLIPVDGGEARAALEIETAVEGYAWSPDGTRAAIIAAPAESERERELAEHGFDQEVFEEDWRPHRVWIADLAAGGEPQLLALDGSAVHVRFSPDGERLAVSLAPSPLVDDRLMFQRVVIVSAATGEVEASIDRAGKLEAMAWSPRGSRLAMIGAADVNDPSASSLLVAPASGGPGVNLTPGFEGSVSAVEWLDESTLLVLADVGVRTELYRVGADGGRLEPVGRRDDGVVYTSLSVADDGRTAALLGESPDHPSEVFAVDLAAGEPPRRLTDANPWLAEVRLAPQEVLRFKARDGLQLEGLLLRPLDGTPDRAAPLVMVVHGGPEGHRRHGWLSRYSAPAQVLAGRGYAVFFPNYRGSTGRGVAFTKLGQQDPAGAEFDDLLDAVDALVAAGIADPERVGVTGGSYGGYATAWLATRHSERIAAGVMFVGISNLISKFGTTDIPREEFLVHALAYPWDRWRFFVERSPLAHVERARTPLLIAGGTDDPRVSPTQSMELYRALEVLGRAPVRLVRYPNEPHGNLRGASRYDYQLRLLRWFDHYLRGAGGDPPPHELEYRSPEHGWPGDVEF